MLRSARRTGFTLIELMVVSAVSTVMFTQLVQAITEAREAARRSQCKNNLKQIGLAFHNYHDVFNGFPMGWVGCDTAAKQPDVRGMGGFGWGTAITPFMDQAKLYNQFDFSVAVDAPQNAKLIVKPIAAFRCASDPFVKKTWKLSHEKGDGEVELATANYVGSFGTEDLIKCETMKPGEVGAGDGLLFHNSFVKLNQIKDGTSNTIAVGERTGNTKSDHLATWAGVIAKGKHPFSRILSSSHAAPDAEKRSDSDYYSGHDKGSHFLLCDGSVRFISRSLDAETFRAITTRDGSEEVPDF